MLIESNDNASLMLCIANSVLGTFITLSADLPGQHSKRKPEADLSPLAATARPKWGANVTHCSWPRPPPEHPPSRAGPIQNKTAESHMHSWVGRVATGTISDFSLSAMACEFGIWFYPTHTELGMRCELRMLIKVLQDFCTGC